MAPEAGSAKQPRSRLPVEGTRAVGGPIPLGLLASYVALALVGWLAAAIVLVVAAPDLAAGAPMTAHALLAAHLIAIGFLPLAVTGAAFHLLPVMLRNPVRHTGRIWVALPLLALGGWLAAPGIAFDAPVVLWPGVILLSGGLALVLYELSSLVVHAPGGRLLVASRTGIALSMFHAVVALVLGAIVFDHGDASVFGVTHERWLLIHLHIALLGWLALLIVAVGRTLAPMLALAPAASARRLPLEETLLTAGLWLLVVGIATSRIVALAGSVLILSALGRFGALVARVVRTRRIELEGPLAHLLVGGVFLIEAAAIGLLVLARVASLYHGLTAYVLLLLLGWAAGVTLGHLPKLLSLSIWVWWPPGPRPKQSALYPRRSTQAEAVVFAAGVQLLASASYFDSPAIARAGAAILVCSSLLSLTIASWIWQQRAQS